MNRMRTQEEKEKKLKDYLNGMEISIIVKKYQVRDFMIYRWLKKYKEEWLEGTPNELKLKYISHNKFNDLKGEELKEAIKGEIKKKESDLKGNMLSEGTTPRRLTDLIGSLCDLTSGSGDKGTPVVFIQGYFDNLADE